MLQVVTRLISLLFISFQHISKATDRHLKRWLASASEYLCICKIDFFVIIFNCAWSYVIKTNGSNNKYKSSFPNYVYTFILVIVQLRRGLLWCCFSSLSIQERSASSLICIEYLPSQERIQDCSGCTVTSDGVRDCKRNLFFIAISWHWSSYLTNSISFISHFQEFLRSFQCSENIYENIYALYPQSSTGYGCACLCSAKQLSACLSLNIWVKLSMCFTAS